MYNLVLNSSDCVDIFVVVCGFQIYVEQVQRVFGLSVADICYVADCVAKVKYLTFDVVSICSVVKVFEHHSKRTVFL